MSQTKMIKRWGDYKIDAKNFASVSSERMTRQAIRAEAKYSLLGDIIRLVQFRIDRYVKDLSRKDITIEGRENLESKMGAHIVVRDLLKSYSDVLKSMLNGGEHKIVNRMLNRRKLYKFSEMVIDQEAVNKVTVYIVDMLKKAAEQQKDAELAQQYRKQMVNSVSEERKVALENIRAMDSAETVNIDSLTKAYETLIGELENDVSVRNAKPKRK